MYTATMEYAFKAGKLSDGLRIWKETVLPAAQGREGLVEMLLLSQSTDRFLALGIWSEKSYAEAFMQTGIFKTLKDRLSGILEADPQPRIWDLEERLGR